MRKIASKAGFIDDESAPDNDFLLVTEPEAAALYCIKYMEETQNKAF